MSITSTSEDDRAAEADDLGGDADRGSLPCRARVTSKGTWERDGEEETPASPMSLVWLWYYSLSPSSSTFFLRPIDD